MGAAPESKGLGDELAGHLMMSTRTKATQSDADGGNGSERREHRRPMPAASAKSRCSQQRRDPSKSMGGEREWQTERVRVREGET